MTQPRTAMSAAIAPPALASRRRRALLTAGAASGATSVIGGGGLLAAGLLTGRSVQAQGKLGKAVYGQGSIDPIFTAGYVALKKGFFGEAGLDVEYLNSQSGPRTNQMLAAGQILFGATAATAAPALTVAGKPAALIFGFDRRMTYANVIVRKDEA